MDCIAASVVANLLKKYNYLDQKGANLKMNRNLKISLGAVLGVLVLGLVVFMGTSNIQAETAKKASSFVGYVDVMAVFAEHPDKAQAEQKLNEEVKAMQAELEKEVKDKPQDQRQAIMQKYQEKLALREQELISEVIKNIDLSIQEVANELGIQVVLEKKSVIYGGQDLTEEVKERVLAKANKQ